VQLVDAMRFVSRLSAWTFRRAVHRATRPVLPRPPTTYGPALPDRHEPVDRYLADDISLVYIPTDRPARRGTWSLVGLPYDCRPEPYARASFSRRSSPAASE
jgi:hypothetical protein